MRKQQLTNTPENSEMAKSPPSSHAASPHGSSFPPPTVKVPKRKPAIFCGCKGFAVAYPAAPVVILRIRELPPVVKASQPSFSSSVTLLRRAYTCLEITSDIKL